MRVRGGHQTLNYQTILDLILQITTVLLPIAIPLIFTYYYTGKTSKKLQIKFVQGQSPTTRQTGTYAIVRNLSNQNVYVDSATLIKSEFVRYSIHIDKYCNAEFSILIRPGQQTLIFLPGLFLEKVFFDTFKKCKIIQLGVRRRIPFKLELSTSAGIVSTTWFKIGNKYEPWQVYDYIYHKGATYSVGTSIDDTSLGIWYLIPLMLSLMGVAYCIEDSENGVGYGLLLIGYFSTLILVVLHASTGIRNRQRTISWAIVASLPLFIVMAFMMPNIAVLVMFFIVWSCNWTIVERKSGWDV